MRYFIEPSLLAAVLILAGCATTEVGQNVPLPESTPFDANAMARQVYLDAYRDGYRAVAVGGSSAVDSMRGPNQHVRELGWRAGAADAQRQKGEK